ncbi:diguanylate cyclase [Aurantivibrio infirmus]
MQDRINAVHQQIIRERAPRLGAISFDMACPPMKILLVEDSATLRYTMCNYIKQAGHESVVAESGEEALQLIETTPVDLVIMDVEMPGLNGFETTSLMRETFGSHWVPIIFVTGMSDAASFHEGIEAGGDDYMTKPISLVVLKAKLRALERITAMQHKLHRLNEELQHLSQNDGLTELYNRRAFEEIAEKQWQVITRAHNPVSVLMIDVDHFKTYNDYYGHHAGDDCLKKVAQILKQTLHRPADILARYGGEEFIALLPDTDLSGAKVVADALRTAIEDAGIPHERSNHSEFVTVSIGGASADHTTGLPRQELGKEADKALYEAKDSGRNCTKVRQIAPHKTVLIADEDNEMLALLSDVLRKEYNILTTNNGVECLEIIHNIHPDLLILDESLERNSEVNIHENIAEDKLTAKMPTISIGSKETITNSKFSKASNRYLQKPIEADNLLTTIYRILS